MNTLDINLNKFTKTFRIGSFDSDLNGKVKITSICNFLQEIAGMHADALNWGIDQLRKQNLSWVLSRLKLDILKYPVWQEEISIETWPTGIKGLYGNRDFRIFNKKGECIMLASSSWLIINFKTKRPIRPHSIIDNSKYKNAEKVFGASLQKLKIDLSNANEFEVNVHYSDIDINQHVNNVKYIKWIIDSCPINQLRTEAIGEIEINFLHEAKYNDKLSVYSNCNSNDICYFNIQNQENKLEHCRAIIKWIKPD